MSNFSGIPSLVIATATEFQLLRDYEGQSVVGWLMTEKFDGWRAIWDGENFVSRQGLILDTPDWFKVGMPAMPLDGEIWNGRGGFNGIQSAMVNGWHGLRFVIFDHTGNGVFRQRLRDLKSLNLPRHCRVAQYTRCDSTPAFLEFGEHIIAENGEGAVVRDPRAKYTRGRCDRALRIKSGVCLA